MHWIQLSCSLSPAHSEAFEEALLAAGASAVTMADAEDQPIFEPELGTTPLWQYTRVTGLFSAEEDIESARAVACDVFRHLTGEQAPQIKTELLENEDWTRKWIENFKPIQFGKRLWVCPSWCEAPDAEGINLMLDPGLAFGTGTHPTTSLCLKWLDQANLKGKTVIDYGCGSGILGIAALLLGADKVIAIDNDPQALQATKENAKNNGIDPARLETYLPEDIPRVEATLLVANILAKPLEELRDHFHQLLPSGGELVLSGILENQADHLLEHYAKGFNMAEPKVEAGWVCLSGCKL